MRTRLTLLALVLMAAVLGAVLVPAAAARPVWTPPRQLAAAGTQAAIAANDAGDSVAVWVGRSRAVVYGSFRVRGGVWSSAAVISDPVIYVSAPRVVLDSSSRATVTWSSFDGGPMGSSGSYDSLLTARGRPGRSWSSPHRLAGSVYGDSGPVVDRAGTVSVAWLDFHGCVDADVDPCTPEETAAGRTHVTLASRPANGAWSAAVDLGEGDSPVLAARPNGGLDAVWLTRPARRSPAGTVTTASRSEDGAWSSRATLASGDGWAAPPELVVGRGGRVTAGWAVCDGPESTQSCRQQTVSHPAAGAWGTVSTLPERVPGEAGRSAVDLAVDGAGRVTALWWEGSLVASTRDAAGWGPLQDVTSNGAGIRDPDLAADRMGNLLATWFRTSSSARSSTVRAAYRPAAGAWGPTFVVDRSRVVQFDYTPSARVVAVGARFTVLHDGRGVVVRDRVERTAPVARMRRPSARAVTRTRVRVTWTARDLDTGVGRVEVRRRSAGYRSTLLGWSSWRQGTTASAATLSGRPGRTYCFAVRARDRAGNWSTWSHRRCVSTPVDDRTLQASDGWRRVRSAATSYRGTETHATRRGSELRLGQVRARRLYVVATTCPRCGSVRVQLGSRLLTRVSLRSTTVRHRRLMPVAAFPRARQGTLRLRVTSAGRLVRIDGVVAAR